MGPTFTSSILSQHVSWMSRRIGGIYSKSKSSLLTVLILCFSLFNLDAYGQSEADRTRIIEKSNQEALQKIIEMQNKKYQTDLLEAKRRGIPELITNQNGQIGSFHSLLPDGSPTYDFDDIKPSPETKSFQLPAKMKKRQAKKSGYPAIVKNDRNQQGLLYAVKDNGQPIYYFQEIALESETQTNKSLK